MKRVAFLLCVWLPVWGCLGVALILASACGGQGAAVQGPGSGEQAARFQIKAVSVDGYNRRYALYVPADYDARKPWPLILFLHGWGERGNDGKRPTEVGLGPMVLRYPERFPALVVIPQLPRTQEGDALMDENFHVIQAADASGRVSEREVDIAIAKLARAYPRQDIEAVFQAVAEQYSVDTDRVYLTGMSLGGFAAWNFAVANPTRFAAMSIVSGGGDSRLASYLPQLPIRFAHGADDITVPPYSAQRLVRALQKGGGDVDITLYPGAAHEVWQEAYADEEWARWLFQQRL